METRTRADEKLWHQARIMLTLECHGGQASKDIFFGIGAREGYDPRGMGGFSRAAYRMVECVGDRRILTDLGRERLNQARRRWPGYFQI